ncbi:conserved hypothetical protein [Gloeothece citriformis PCC 7424]|uniref:DUF3110 domain-containing protein n=1 Tax=Gloeothece citriformis (strain PCC 7424) TaxID=65393 RepID=B7KFK6_GLOC7|nr:DUF3110 domain-containing protein [Gloeothece citriformis]ACK73331.1 conserved hypothetical protein [Gloeothece citriformis PCC 7424]
MRVYVLLYNVGTENEGIHTVQMGEKNKVLMFESQEDAIRYALLLEAQDFPSASVESIDSEEVEEFCRSANYDWELIKNGKLEIPPEKNVEQTEWSPEDNPSQKWQQPETETPSEMSSEELERIRRKLEGLL